MAFHSDYCTVTALHKGQIQQPQQRV